MILQVGPLFQFRFAVNFRVWYETTTLQLPWSESSKMEKGNPYDQDQLPVGRQCQDRCCSILALSSWWRSDPNHRWRNAPTHWRSSSWTWFTGNLVRAILCMCQLRAGHELSGAKIVEAWTATTGNLSAFCGWLSCLDHGITCSCRTP